MAVKETIYENLLDFLHYTQTPDDSTARRIQDEAAAGLEYLKRYFDPDATYDPGTRGYALLWGTSVRNLKILNHRAFAVR